MRFSCSATAIQHSLHSLDMFLHNTRCSTRDMDAQTLLLEQRFVPCTTSKPEAAGRSTLCRQLTFLFPATRTDCHMSDVCVPSSTANATSTVASCQTPRAKEATELSTRDHGDSSCGVNVPRCGTIHCEMCLYQFTAGFHAVCVALRPNNRVFVLYFWLGNEAVGSFRYLCTLV